MNLRVLSVNSARAALRLIEGKPVLTAIAKQPVAGAVAVGPMGLAGDEQADLTVHGGQARAVYAYPAAHYAFWRTVRAQAGVAGWNDALAFGAMGENLSLDGVTEDQLWVGDRLRFPGCTLVVSEPRRPCFKFNAAIGFAHGVKLMAESGYCGSYLAVLHEGHIQAGDDGVVEPGQRQVNLRELFMAQMRRR